MKSVLISIRPKWVERIASGQKTIEVRKTAPQEVPFKCYIYETKGQYVKFTHGAHTKYGYGRGKVIGEFICDKVHNIEPIFRFYDNYSEYDDWSDSRFLEDYSIDDERLRKTCLTRRDLYIYGKEKTLYGWHIFDLKIYDKPRALSEFKTPPCEKSEKACGNCKWLVKINTPDVYECECYVEDGRPITRPPQSWQYVEDLGEVK